MASGRVPTVVRREWDAAILEQVPDQKIAWAATEGATNAGAVYFIDRALAEPYFAGSLPVIRSGLADLDERGVTRAKGNELPD